MRDMRNDDINENNEYLSSFDKSLKLDDSDSSYAKELNKIYSDDFDADDESTYYVNHPEKYKELQDNIILYKNGNREAAEYIVRAFHSTLKTYCNFIVLHSIPHMKYKDASGREKFKITPTIARFIKLYGGKLKKGSGWSVRNVTQYIFRLYDSYDYGDIYNQLVLALLNMANKYKVITDESDPRYRPNGTFHIYVQKCFCYEAFRYLKELSKDPIIFSAESILSIEQDCQSPSPQAGVDSQRGNSNPYEAEISLKHDTSQKIIKKKIDEIDREAAIENSSTITLKENDLDLTDESSLNFNWINGVTCGDAFKNLTSMEREILILSYLKNKTDSEIGMLYGCSRFAIMRYRNKAISKIQESLDKG